MGQCGIREKCHRAVKGKPQKAQSQLSWDRIDPSSQRHVLENGKADADLVGDVPVLCLRDNRKTAAGGCCVDDTRQMPVLVSLGWKLHGQWVADTGCRPGPSQQALHQGLE
ncbi:hypothetical protein BaRGS_00027146 [Batillaria attramentaria]|uniref:Uncharacterized protein n=1 Tax=Batillaria attramentaria TaxID=370345 RepID=A0ABD0K404_9CAEN